MRDPARLRPTKENLHTWANQAEDDLDGIGAYRLRQAAGRIAQLEGEIEQEREISARLQAHVDRLELMAHSIRVLRVHRLSQQMSAVAPANEQKAARTTITAVSEQPLTGWLKRWSGT
jgi:hypothetical protein